MGSILIFGGSRISLLHSSHAKNQLDSSSRFDTIPACDGQNGRTDRRTDKHTTNRKTHDDSKYHSIVWRAVKTGNWMVNNTIPFSARSCFPFAFSSSSARRNRSAQRNKSRSVMYPCFPAKSPDARRRCCKGQHKNFSTKHRAKSFVQSNIHSPAKSHIFCLGLTH